MVYTSETVVDYFWHLARVQGEFLDVLKIHRLVYVATCWGWAILDRPLLNERLRATKYGPVVPSMLERLKGLGAGPLREPLAAIGEQQAPNFDAETERFLNCVWVRYGGLSGIQLTRLIHDDPESPWRQALSRSHHDSMPEIEPHSMRDRYLRLIVGSQTANRG